MNMCIQIEKKKIYKNILIYMYVLSRTFSKNVEKNFCFICWFLLFDRSGVDIIILF